MVEIVDHSAADFDSDSPFALPPISAAAAAERSIVVSSRHFGSHHRTDWPTEAFGGRSGYLVV